MAISPTLVTAITAAFENALNRALEHAPATQSELATLDGSVFALHCSAPELEVFLQPTGEGLRLMGVYDGEVTTRISGRAADFADLVTASDPAATLINGNLVLEGDSAPLLELQQILAALDMDWEAPLVDTLGDVAGHQVAQTLRALAGWGNQASRSLARQFDEYIHEEARLTPPRLELEDFYRDVQDLVMRVDRLQSLTERFRRRLQKLQD
jgi:ubiquinone biosynthesis protein UbiJ